MKPVTNLPAPGHPQVAGGAVRGTGWPGQSENARRVALKLILILVTLADLALGVLLISVSGFILQGVNNTGPSPGAAGFVLMAALCFLAPLGGWWLRARAGGWAVILAALPLLLGAGLLADPR